MFTANLQQASFNPVTDTEKQKLGALAIFAFEMRKAKWGRLVAKMKGNSYRLLDLKELRPNLLEESLSYIGARTVAIDRIRGTEGRSQDFDINFRPLTERSRGRWLQIALIVLRGDSLPAVELVKSGDYYFVRDGHHRISVARALGQKYIDAIVTSL